MLPGDVGVVSLDLETDEALEAEGTARDVIRLVQQAPRQAGLEVSDRIELELTTSGPVAAAIERWREFVSAQVLATGLSVTVGQAAGERLPSGDEVLISLARA